MPGLLPAIAVFLFLGVGDPLVLPFAPWPPPPPPPASAPLPPPQSLPNPPAAGPSVLPLLASSELPRDDDTALRFGGEQRLVSGHPPSEQGDPFPSATDGGDFFVAGAEPKFLRRKAPSPRLCSSSSLEDEDVSSRSSSEAGRRGGGGCARSILPLRLLSPIVALFAGRPDNHGCPI